jgi:hypothetical protein
MKRTVFWALVALNVVLLATLLAPYIKGNQAMAQRAGANRRPELLMIPGQQIAGGNADVVYLVDTANRRLGAVSLNQKGNGLDSMAPQLLDRVFEDRALDGGRNAPGGRNPGKAKP